jgi:hypothetical protein
VLEDAYNKCLEAGEITIEGGKAGPMVFKIVMEESWRADITTLVN